MNIIFITLHEKSFRFQLLNDEWSRLFNLSSPDIPLERNEKYSSSDYIPFGNNNLFPQAIAEINRNSPIHRGIMNMKTHFLKGKGFSTEKDNKKLSEWLLKANNKNESAITVCAKLMKDKVHSGNAYVEIVTDKRRSFVNIFHKDYTTCRLSKDAKSILIHGDWENYQSKKVEKAIQMKEELQKEALEYCKREDEYIKTTEAKLHHEKTPLSHKEKELEHELAKAKSILENAKNECRHCPTAGFAFL
jgi:hypothetical protein